MNDRRFVELMLFVDLLQHVVEKGANDLQSPEAQAALANLNETRRDLIKGITSEAKSDQLARRLARIDRAVMAPHRTVGAPVGEFGLIVYVLLRDLTDSGYLALDFNGPMFKATELVLAGLEPFAQLPGGLEKAERKAAIVVADLQREGYLPGFASRRG